MSQEKLSSISTLPRDLTAGVVVFLVALPLCLGIAIASNASPFSGLLAGIVGGLVVGCISRSHTSVSGPAAALAAIVVAQIAHLGSFRVFLLAVVIAGVFQVILGLLRAGFISAYFPTSVIKGLLAAIGIILILKQIPHVLGHDTDPEGEMSFSQIDHENTFSELAMLVQDFHVGAAVVGLLSIALLLFWERCTPLKKSIVPAQLVVVLFGVALSELLRSYGGGWVIGSNHLVQVPVAESLAGFMDFLQLPDFSQWNNPAVYGSAVTIAIVASLASLMNLEAADRLDRKQRVSPTSRELLAQGVGNIAVGMIGGIPMTSEIVRSSVNINAGGQTKLATIIHGGLLLICVALLPACLNLIPLSCLAAILLVTGIKLASPALVRQMWNGGRYQFIPFVATVVSITLTDTLIGILIGLAVSLTFILHSNMRRPMHRIVEKHLGGEVTRIELANQVSFLSRAAIDKVFNEVPRGAHLLLDASNTVYIDPDILSLIREYKEVSAPVRGVQVSLRGFRERYKLQDDIQFVDYSTRELQDQLTSTQVLQILMEGNERFRTGRRLTRDLGRQLDATARGQHPLAVIHSCIDSRTPAELVFDLGLGDIFSIRVAGNVMSPKVLGSMEYGCAVAGAKLIFIMGHTKCGAVSASVDCICAQTTPTQATGCHNLEPIVEEIQESIELKTGQRIDHLSPQEKEAFVNEVARKNVLRTVDQIMQHSETINRLVHEGKIALVGAMYDVGSGSIEIVTKKTGKTTESYEVPQTANSE